jgi:hypothetical protein
MASEYVLLIMTRWIETNDWYPEEYENVLIIYRRKNGECVHYAIGYFTIDNEEQNDGHWMLTEPLEVNYYPSHHNEQIEVLCWTLLPELPDHVF